MTFNATVARAMFPQVRGTIFGAEMHRDGVILNMGPKSFGVIFHGEFIACCPTITAAAAIIERSMKEVAA